MPATTFPEYARAIQDALDELVVGENAVLVSLTVDQRSSLRGFIAGSLKFQDESELHFREFVDISQTDPRIMYAYHYQDADANLVFRYDNAAHRPALPKPGHRHVPSGVEILPPPTLFAILDRIVRRTG